MEKSKYKHDYIRVYQYGTSGKSQVIYFKTPRLRQLPEQSPDVANCGDGPAGRADSNICRARSRVRELALCNQWEYFVTLTLDKERYDRYNLVRFQTDLTQWVRNQRRLKGCDIQYLLIPEQHKDGAWHMHGLVHGLAADMLRAFTLDERLPVRILDQLRQGKQLFELPGISRKFGWTTASPIGSLEGCANYITKYISKDAAATAATLEAGRHLYYASRGLRGKQLLYEGPIANAGAIPWGYENEYCKLLWTNDLNFLEVDPVFLRSTIR